MGHNFIYCFRSPILLKIFKPLPQKPIFFCRMGDLVPTGIKAFDALQVPLLNTVGLLASGVRVNWAYHSLIEINFRGVKQGLLWTVF